VFSHGDPKSDAENLLKAALDATLQKAWRVRWRSTVERRDQERNLRSA